MSSSQFFYFNVVSMNCIIDRIHIFLSLLIAISNACQLGNETCACKTYTFSNIIQMNCPERSSGLTMPIIMSFDTLSVDHTSSNLISISIENKNCRELVITTNTLASLINTLRVTHSQIRMVRARQLLNFLKLTILDLSQNEIEFVSVDAFYQMPALVELDLHANKLARIGKHSNFTIFVLKFI